MAGPFGGSRVDSLRRLAELTGLGIAASYFLDPEEGAGRRRALRSWVAGASAGPAPGDAPAGRGHPTASPPVEPVPPEQDPRPEVLHDAIVLPAVERLSGRAAPDDEGAWPTWGWTLVVTVTVCALVAFAAIGVGVWSIKTGRPAGTTTVLAPPARPAVPAAAVQALADPDARRVVARTAMGQAILVVRPTGAAALVVDGFPPAPPGRVYRVWLSAGGATKDAGRFAATRAVLALPWTVAAGDRVRITEESSAAAASGPRGRLAADVGVPSRAG